MTTPAIVEVDPHAPQVLSPIKDYTLGTGDVYQRNGDELRRSRKQAVEMKNYNELRGKYLEAKKRMERMKEESANNKRMLLEMSSVVNALKDISVDYDHDASAVATPIVNVQKKIRAIDAQLKSAMLQCGHLEQEKELQNSTIKAQESHIKTMEDQINILQKQLKKALADKHKTIASEKQTLSEMNKNGEMISTIKAQEAKIAALEEQVRKFSVDNSSSSIYHQIEALNGSHQAKYLEIQAMEQKLEMLRNAQQGLSLDKDVKTSKHVTFVPDTHLQLDRNKSRSTDQSSHSSSSCGTGHSSSLTSVSEENSGSSHEDDDGIYSDDRGSSFSSRSFSTEDSSTRDEQHSTSIRISTSHDENVEIVVGNKGRNLDVSDVSYSTEDSADTPTVNFEKEYNKALMVIRELQGDNEKLRKSHSQALSSMAHISEFTSQAEQTKKEYEELKKIVEELRQSATLANTKYEKLRREHSKTVEDLKDERARYSQLMKDYSKVSHRQSEVENYEKLKQLHDALVMKVGDMAEESEKTIVQLNETRKERDRAESKARALASELDATINAYQDLQKDNDVMMMKVNKVSQQCDEFKTKYYELLAGDESMRTESTLSKDERYEALRREYESLVEKFRGMESKVLATEKQKRDYSEALAKIQVLEQCNKELEEIREKFHAAEAQVTLLKRDNAAAAEAAKTAKKREEQRALHLKDMLAHYKVLENEHEEVCQKLKRLQAVVSNKNEDDVPDPLQLGPAGPGALADQAKAAAFHSKMAAYERRIKELQQQRDSALEQMTQLEEELSQARLEKVEAAQSRKDRERDLKVVLGHYHSLQKEHEALKANVERLEKGLIAEGTQHTASTNRAVLVENKKGHEEVHGSELLECCEMHDSERVRVDHGMKSEDEGLGDVDIVSQAPEDDIDKDQSTREPLQKDGPVLCVVTSGDIKVSMEHQVQTLDDADTDAEIATDNDTVARLLIDMETMKRHKVERAAEQAKKDARTDMSTVSNVSEGLSMENSVGSAEHSASALSDEAPSTSWKDIKIAKLMSELEHAKNAVCALEEKEKSAQAQMEITERKLLVAQREAEDAKKRQNAREGNLRDAIAQQKRLENEYKQVQEMVTSLQEQLEQAKKEARVREEETKAARKRAASYHTQFKKLQEKHEEAMKVIQDQGRQIEMLEDERH